MGEGRGFEFAFGGGGVTSALAPRLEELVRRAGRKPFWGVFGDCDWNGLIWISSVSSWEEKGFSSASLGRSDSVDPLFLRDRVGGRSCSSNRASSIWRRAIWPLSSSSRLFHSGTDVQRVIKASKVEKLAAAIVLNAEQGSGRAVLCCAGIQC